MAGQHVLSSHECQRLAFDLTHIWNKRLENSRSGRSFDLRKWALVILTLSIISCFLVLPRFGIQVFSGLKNGELFQNDTEDALKVEHMEATFNTSDDWELPNLSFVFTDVDEKVPGVLLFFVIVVLAADICAVIGVLMKRSFLLIPFIVAFSTIVWILFFLFMLGDAWNETDNVRIKTMPNLVTTTAMVCVIWSYYDHLRRAEATEKIKEILHRNNHEVRTRVSKDKYTDVPVYNYPSSPQNVVLINKMFP